MHYLSEKLLDLDTLLETAPVRAALARSDEASASEALRLLAESGGALTHKNSCGRTADRHARRPIDESTSTEKPKSTRPRLTMVRSTGGVDLHMVHLTAVGWAC